MNILETGRLLLRPWQAEDAGRLYELARDPDVGPRAPYDFNSQSRRVIEKCGFRYRFHKETTDLLGATYDTLFYVLTREEWKP